MDEIEQRSRSPSDRSLLELLEEVTVSGVDTQESAMLLAHGVNSSHRAGWLSEVC